MSYEIAYGQKNFLKIPDKVMNAEIQKYNIYLLNKSGKLIRIYSIKSTKDYNHSQFHLHHYIEFQQYEANKEWFIERGIEQKLILVTIATHEQIHCQAVKTLSDEEFKIKYKISRDGLLFRLKYYKYEG